MSDTATDRPEDTESLAASDAALPAAPEGEAAGALELGPDWTIVQAAELQQRLLAQLGSQFEDCVLDLSHVQSMDSAGLQLLLALRTSLRERELSLWLQEPSAAVLAAMDTYGLRQELLGA